MKKHLFYSISIIGIVGIWRISQIIFGVLYSSTQDSYLGIKTGKRVDTIAPHGGYHEQQIDNFTNSKPLPYTTSLIGNYQKNCKYGIGKCIAFLGQDALAAFYWIHSIQYIAKDVNITTASDITNRLGKLYDIAPTRYYPYILGQYIGPPSQSNNKNIDNEIARNNTVLLGEQGIHTTCDMTRVDKIIQMDYSDFIQELQNPESSYRNTCLEGGELAHTLAFNYFYYLGNYKKATQYYMLASFHNNVPTITASMPALLASNEGNHRLSSYLWYDRLQNALMQINNTNKLNNDELLSLKENIQKATIKTISEYTLSLLDAASENAREAGASLSCSQNLSCLLRDGYINTLITTDTQECSTTNSIVCEIIALGKHNKRINNYSLAAPEPQKHYERNTDNNLGPNGWIYR